MGHFITYFSAIFFVAYMTIAFVYPSVRTYRETGVNPITFGKEDNAHDFIGKWFKIILGLIPVVIVCNSVGEGAYQWLLPARYLEIPEMQFTGVVLCILSLIWTAIAQYHMGTAWRIGIDNKHKTGLVTFGLFKLSRNPIFLGMLFTLVGFFMLLPNAITLTVLIAGYLLIHIQVRLEEEFLSGKHGESYTHYKSKVKRFL